MRPYKRADNQFDKIKPLLPSRKEISDIRVKDKDHLTIETV